MGYSVDYRPTRKRAKRAVPKNKAQRTKDIKNVIRWNIERLEHDTVGTDMVRRCFVINLLRLNKIAPEADPTGDHVLQELISRGVLRKPVSRSGVQVFDRADLLTSLKCWVGML